MSLKHKYDADYYYQKASQVLETVTNSDIESWYLHPCTDALMLLLEGDLANLVTSWKAGAYTSSTADQTLQLNSSKIGQCACIDAVLDYIKDIRRRDVGENT